MWHWLGQIPVYQARRWTLVYFNLAVWVCSMLIMVRRQLNQVGGGEVGFFVG